MQSLWALLILHLVLCNAAVRRNDINRVFIELTELGYEDTCQDTAEAERSFINKPSNETLSIWEERMLAYAEFKKVQKDEVQNISISDTSDTSLKYKYNAIERAGDALLNNEDFGTLVRFYGTIDMLKAMPISVEGKNYTYKDVDDVLSHNNDIETKKTFWTKWHERFSPFVQNISQNLDALQKAVEVNDAESITQYWEILSGCQDCYDKIKYEWNEIKELHQKVLNFAKNTLSQKYGVNITENIPAYLLGSLEGSTWTPVATDITTTPNLIYDLREKLWNKKFIGSNMYKTASSLGSTLLTHVPQAEFWEKSQFNQQCPSMLINYCRDGIMSVSTCFEPTLDHYLDAHKNIGKVLYNQMSVEATPVLNVANRYSALEEGVSELFGILSASPAWFNHTHLMDHTLENEQRQIISLTITALNVLPRLAYYLAADMWRINAIETEIKNTTDLVSSWWTMRQEYEGVTSNETDLPTFINDQYILRNKPYLPKFVGTLVAFQMYEFLMENTEVRYDRLIGKHINPKFIRMIQLGAADSWVEVLEKYLEIDDISASPLMSFFTPLEDFIDGLEEDFKYESLPAKEKELVEIEEKMIAEITAPVTTTTPATTTTVVTRRRMTNSTESPKQDTKSNRNATSLKNLEPKSSIHVEDGKSGENNTLQTDSSTKVPLDESLINNIEEDDNKPKINTSKAVWAVGAALVAIVIICIIVIFGGQRCRKTPKNRRYV